MNLHAITPTATELILAFLRVRYIHYDFRLHNNRIQIGWRQRTPPIWEDYDTLGRRTLPIAHEWLNAGRPAFMADMSTWEESNRDPVRRHWIEST